MIDTASNVSEVTNLQPPGAPLSDWAVVVFGRDQQGKAHASRFEPADAALAETAAGLMGMRALRLETGEQQELGAVLPVGRVFATGRAFVPFVKAAVFEKLDSDPAAFSPERPPEAEVPPAAPRRAKGAHSAVTATQAATNAQEGASGPAQPPVDNASITVGHRVLAAELNDAETWFLAEVTALEGPDLLQLRWASERYCREPRFERHRDHLALLPIVVAPSLS
ncbi:MAG: hypothetical protein ACRYGP_26700 [Janthinobacterium lividum]